ncbi:hypothetical protein BU15DRAFT_89746 [Melanogaster broomeanus]|nr:hypothetical protein BU15DRAFT_89746 [Melanogaster broomeanus]
MGSTTPLLDILSKHLPTGISLAEIPSSSESRKGSKRARESEDADESSSKRHKTADVDVNDSPLFTLPSISTTSPIRKKVDITIHERSIRFINTGTRAVESSIPLSSISRAFLLPTRGKAKEHWTVVLLPTDVPDKGKAPAASSQQVIFGLDALTLKPLRTVFRSACATAKSGNGAAGVNAYLSAKAGTLWFFDTGILWGESKPCEFWAVPDLTATDGVRLISATGRTCSPKDANKDGDDEAGEDEGEEIVETEFTMVDGREQDPINAWTRQRKRLFGKDRPMGKELLQVRSRNGTAKGPAWDDSDSDDEDYEIPSSEDLGHNSSSDSDGNKEDQRSDDGDGSGSEGVEESGDDQKLIIPYSDQVPCHAVSKAVIDAVVDMVNEDLMDDASDEEDELEE